MELGSDESMKGFEIFLQTSELCFKTLPSTVHESLTGQQTNFPLGLLADFLTFFWKGNVAESFNDQTVAMIQDLVNIRGDCIMRDDTVQILTFGKHALGSGFSTFRFQVCCVFQVITKAKNGFVISGHS